MITKVDFIIISRERKAGNSEGGGCDKRSKPRQREKQGEEEREGETKARGKEGMQPASQV